MKIFYFESHPDKPYLWRLSSKGQKKYSELVESQGFCASAYYTLEMSDMMYRCIEEYESTHMAQDVAFSGKNAVSSIDTIVIKRMFISLIEGNYRDFETSKQRII